MAKLTQSQSLILSNAAARGDGAAIVPTKMTKSTATKIGQRLIASKLMREAKPKHGLPIWRHDATGRPISLIITAAGRKAVGVCGDASEGDLMSAAAVRVAGAAGDAREPIGNSLRPNGDPLPSPRAGSKKALLIAMLSTETGATIDDLTKATGWLSHTTRAALTGLRKAGYPLERFKSSDGVTTYKIPNCVSVVKDPAEKLRQRRRKAGEAEIVPPTA